MEGPEHRARLHELETALETHPALLISQQMEEFDRVCQWSARNAAELLLVIRSLNEEGLGMRLMAQSQVAWGDDEHRDFVTELGRAWHNYVAGANTVVDHMRALFKDQPEDLQREYSQHKAQLLGPHDVVDFISRSRNILLHRGVFNTGITWQFSSRNTSLTDSNFEVTCATDALLKRYATWWNGKARRYISVKAPRLLLAAAVEEYEVTTEPLHQWYRERFYEYHHPTLANFEQLAQEYRSIKERLEPGSLPEGSDEVYFVDPEERRSSKQQVVPPEKRRTRKKSRRREKRR